MAFKINDERAPLDQFYRANLFVLMNFRLTLCELGQPSGRCFQSMGAERIVRFGGR